MSLLWDRDLGNDCTECLSEFFVVYVKFEVDMPATEPEIFLLHQVITNAVALLKEDQ